MNNPSSPPTPEVRLTPQQRQATSVSTTGALGLYKDMLVGESSWGAFLYAELLTCFLSPLPGLLGLSLRSLLYPFLFAQAGARPAIGRSVIVRGADRVRLGDRVIIDDFACIDARGRSAEIRLGDHVTIGRYTSLVAKNAAVSLAAGTNIGSYCRIASQSQVQIGASVLVGAFCYIGPGNHRRDEQGVPLIEEDMELRGGVKIGSNSWIGAHTTILDGVSIGEGCVIGANSLVKDSLPPHSVAAGSPARILSK